eukprot:gene14473-5535_t
MIRSTSESHGSSLLIGNQHSSNRDGYSDFSQMSDHPIEQADWYNVNSKLRQFGYDPVILTHVSKLNSTASGFVILDEVVASSLRMTIDNLLDDCERKRDLLKELVTSSNQIQRDLDRVRKSHEDNVKEILSLQASLQAEKIKCEEMARQREVELHSHSEEVQKLVAANSKLQTKLKEQKANVVIPSFRPKAHELQEVPEERSRKAEERKETEKEDSRKSVDEINNYDEKVLKMEEELERLRKKSVRKGEGKGKTKSCKDLQKQHERGRAKRSIDKISYGDSVSSEEGQAYSELTESMDTMSLTSTISSGISDAGFLYKRLKITEKKFKEAKKFIKELSEENGKLLAELDKSPTLDASEPNLRRCNHVDDIDFFPIDVCRQHLKAICNRIDVTNINDIARKLDTLEESLNANYRMEKVLRNLLKTVRSHERDVADDVSVCSSRAENGRMAGEEQWKCLVPTIKVWRDELRQLRDLAEAINFLSDNLLPWKQKDSKKSQSHAVSGKVSMETIRIQIRSLADECKTGPIKHSRGLPSKADLQNVVEHFMKLFDVENVAGTFARMNDIYVRNSEMVNVLHTLKDLLGLEKNANSATIVNAVGALAKAKHLLHIDDLDAVIKQLDQYDDFYIAFKSVISDLMEVLGIDDVDEILPAVRALVRFP